MDIARIVFFVAALALWLGAHLYVGRRILTAVEPPRGLRAAGWGLLAGNILLTFVAFFGRRVVAGQSWFETVEWVAYLGMGAFVFLWFLVMARDVLWGSWRLAEKIPGLGLERARESIDPERRRLLFGLSGAAAVAATTGATSYGYAEARRLAGVREVEVPIAGLPGELDGFRIVQISDVHVGPTIEGSYLEAVVDRVNELGADMVAITGDLIDGYVEDMAHEIASLERLRSRHGVWFVTGNHEYYWDAPAWSRAIEELGVRVLHNAHDVIEHEGAKLVVAGATDYSAERHMPEHASNPVEAMRGAPSDAGARVLLAHQPKSVWEAARAGADLQLSGHTHGGQFWPWNMFVGLAHPFVAGLHAFEDMQVYVSRGTGYWGPPMRIGAPSEITVLTLRA
jgi:hypothetical protein